MNPFAWPLQVASLVWELGELHAVQGQVVEELGFGHRFFQYDEPIPDGTDIVLVQGPYGSLLPLASQLGSMSGLTRPVLAYWFGESLQLFRYDLVTRASAALFTELSKKTPRNQSNTNHSSGVSRFNLSRRGHRLGFLGDMFWLNAHGLLDVLALCSSVYAEYLYSRGIDSWVVPRGYHSNYGRLLDLNRDITLLWMGKPRSKRRRTWINRLQHELESMGEQMHVYDGIENDFIFGEQRTQLLNRTKFVLNLNAYGKMDELSIRYFIAAANGAVILREPNDNQYPFVPGKHLVECAPEQMAEVIAHYLNRPDELEKISANMRQLVTTDLTLSKSLETILERATSIFLSRRGDT